MSKDNINPDHYNQHPSGIKCIEITRHMNYNRGSAMAYIWRAGKKTDEIEDLMKAIWHLQDEVETLYNAEKKSHKNENKTD